MFKYIMLTISKPCAVVVDKQRPQCEQLLRPLQKDELPTFYIHKTNNFIHVMFEVIPYSQHQR